MPLKILAIDTSEDACSAALLIGDGVTERFELAPRRHSELILPMMEGLLGEGALSLRELDALAFACGPGAFTGVRIAASVIQGAAFGADLPVVPVSSLRALAQGAQREFAAGRVLSALDARMGEVYWGGFEVDAAGIMRPATGETVCAPASVPLPPGDGWCGVGSGWDSYQALLTERCGVRVGCLSGAMVHAWDVATLAAALFREGVKVAAEQALPVYLRDQVARAPS
jgi:tRNA threonylcarbamoyladenosine biosynthesis protein TsaB